MTSHSMVGRELKRWQPSADDAPLEGGLEDSRGGAWDQFGVNQHKFGVQTSFEVGLTHDVHMQIVQSSRQHDVFTCIQLSCI